MHLIRASRFLEGLRTTAPEDYEEYKVQMMAQYQIGYDLAQKAIQEMKQKNLTGTQSLSE